MRDQLRKILIAFFLLISLLSSGQSQLSAEKEEVIKEAKSQLEGMSSDGGKLFEFCTENSIKGEFVIDITLQGKGKVLTIFMVSSSADDIKYQNLLKSRVTEIQFENIKIPKNERVKFRQTLTF